MIVPQDATLQKIRDGAPNFRRILVAFLASLAEIGYFDISSQITLERLSIYFDDPENYIDFAPVSPGLCDKIRALTDCVPKQAIAARTVKQMLTLCGDSKYPAEYKLDVVVGTINVWTMQSAMESKLLPGAIDDVHIIMHHTAETINLNSKVTFPPFGNYGAIDSRSFIKKYGRPIGTVIKLSMAIPSKYIENRSDRLLQYYSGGDVLALIKAYRLFALNSAPLSGAAPPTPSAQQTKHKPTKILFDEILGYFFS